MKILQIASGNFFSSYGGGQVYVKNIADAFIKLESSDRYKIVVISFTDADKIKRLKYKDCDLYEMPSDCSADTFENIIREIDPAIIHAHSHKDIACRIGKNFHIPVIVTCHHGGILCPAGALLNSKDKICLRNINHNDCLPCVLRNTRTGLKFWYPFVKYLPQNKYISLGEKLSTKPFIPFITPIGIAAKQIKDKKKYWEEIIQKCNVMIAPSKAIAEAMIINGLPKEKIKLLPHGIPLPKVRSKLSEIKNGKIKFFYVGRICHIKGIHIMLEAFHSIQNPDIELHLIGGAGNKDENRYMSKLKKKYRSDNRVVWHGKVEPENIFELINDFHVSIAPTICMEIYGLNIAESQALGKPVLATRCGGAEMQIVDGVNGWLIEPNDVGKLKDKITEILTHPERIVEMSKNCKTVSIEDHCKELLKIYKSVI